MAIGQFGVGSAARDADIQDYYNRQMRQVQEDMMRNPQLGNYYQPGRSQLGYGNNPNGYSAEPQPKKPNKVLLLLNR